MPKGGTRPEPYHPDTDGPYKSGGKSLSSGRCCRSGESGINADIPGTTADQAKRRTTQLPGNDEQHMMIDLRVQEVSPATCEGIRRDLEVLSDGALRPDRIHFLG
jgi:hypothetical protein